ncbi:MULTISPECIES: phage virion morphogenesis protein [Burkholderiaceae]|uniref:phage virion morphogenesis protein n=1 Tax=Burkholderiaceae TaxID=119060 RepID=UPI000976B5D4|nr:phage virion morphogenesis protein [Burkholderia sp. b14]MCG1038174.1 phage virion morphogenesis protein [Mycetohabitans sp. B7]
MMDELTALEQWAGALLARLSPATRRAALHDVARALRQAQKARIAAQRNPDGTAYAPRKARTNAQRLRNKRGRIKRTMFVKLRTARLMRTEVNKHELAVGFVGRASRIARVHQFGEREQVAPRGPYYHYPARRLLGLTDAERRLIRERLLAHIGR